MTVERLLQIHVAILAALGTLLLGMGQREPVLPILSIFAAATSVYFTDTIRWFVMSRTFGNIAALGAVLMSSFQFWTIASDQQLLAIANLLVYLQIILLYQQKNSTRYWEIAVLSLLQVVVAAALNLGFEFGVLLVLYMLTAFSALSLFFVYREGVHYCAADVAPLPLPLGTKKRSLRRQLLGDPLQFGSVTPQTSFADGLMGWNFARNLTALGFMTLLFTVVLFFSVPRTSNAVWQGQDGGLQTGLPTEVTLNERSEIRQSEEVVMRVTFRQPGSDEPMMIAGDPYFYGTVLTHYAMDAGVSRWSNPNTGKAEALAPPPPFSEITYQETVLNTAGQQVLLSAPAVFASDLMLEENLKKLRYDWRSGQLRRRGDEASTRTYSYAIASTGFKGNWQLPVTQHQVTAEAAARSPKLAEQLQAEKNAWLLAIDRERFPTLIAKAEKVLGGSNLAPTERVVAARLLQDHFRTPDAYSYTLDFSKIPRTKDVDPIEDFVANHRTGHCEYFASALCLMLRSQGIPARMVVGYKGGEYNSVGGYYWVRQLHAHAWVEAFLEKDQIPEGAIPMHLVSDTGAWLRLDPTPASDDAEQLAMGVNMLARLGDAMDYVQLLWDDYVLGLNSERQKKSIYTPLGDRAASMIGGMFDMQLWQEQLERLAQSFGINDRGQVFSWRGGLAASLLTATLYLLYQGTASAYRAIRGWWQRRRVRALTPKRKVIEFYERLERLLAQIGIRRNVHQTQREFARTASLQMGGLGPEAAALATLPAQVVDAFYRVRFGEVALDETQASAIEQSLTQLTEYVTRTK